jgi:hypothetical protein
MRFKFSSLVIFFVIIFIAKISYDNMQNVNANETDPVGPRVTEARINDYR